MVPPRMFCQNNHPSAKNVSSRAFTTSPPRPRISQCEASVTSTTDEPFCFLILSTHQSAWNLWKRSQREKTRHRQATAGGVQRKTRRAKLDLVKQPQHMLGGNGPCAGGQVSFQNREYATPVRSPRFAGSDSGLCLPVGRAVSRPQRMSTQETQR